MAGGLRFRSEAFLVTPPASATYTVATKSYLVGTTIIVPVASLVGIQRPGIYRLMLNSVAGATFQFLDTAGGVLSALYTLPANGFFILDTPINGDPWWQPSAPGLGIQITVSATIVGDIYAALGA
jgi:hypothetical protein